jgi:Ca-activated chloride channel family protein
MLGLSFAYPWVLLLLVPVAVVAALTFYRPVQDFLGGSFIFSQTSNLGGVGQSFRTLLRPVPRILGFLALALCIVALARPQTSDGKELHVEGIDIFLALDMSGSMQAVDMSRRELREHLNKNQRPANRFENAKDVLKNFVDSRKHDRIGMTIFAKNAFLQFPLTLDYRTIQSMLDRLKLGDIDKKGTALGNAIGRATSGLKESDASTKILILITDGNRRGGNIAPMKAAEIASELGIKVFPILVGQSGSTFIPVETRDVFGGREKEYRQTDFPVNPKLLKQIAEKTGGRFYEASDRESLQNNIHDILDQFERDKLDDSSTTNRHEHFPPLLIGALVLLLGQGVIRYAIVRRFP